MSSNATGVIFARVCSKEKTTLNNIRGWNYKLSNDAVMFLPNPNLEIGSWNYFEVRKDVFQKMHYVSHCPLAKADGEAVQRQHSQLKYLSHQVTKFWRQLTDQERACVMREIGIVLTGVGAASAAASGVAALIAEEAFLGALTGGISLVVAGGLAGLSYLQYEELKKQLSAKMDTTNALRRARDKYAEMLHDHVPFQYKGKVAFDPEVTSLVTQLQQIFENFKINDLWEMDDDNLTWYGAAA